MFVADPMGAVVGKLMTKYCSKINKNWFKNKTVFGSLAVFISCYACISQFPV